jgi:hypothetical protein
MNWESFAESAPELAALGRDLFDRTGVCLLGTLRRDGSPRISPCEPYVVDGELMLGMMWRSRKALDLLRDPRLVVHSAQCDREGADGDFKLYGRVWNVADPPARQRYADALEAKIDWRPPEPYHLYAVDIESAGFIRFGKEPRALRWTAGGGFERIRHPDEPSA